MSLTLTSTETECMSLNEESTGNKLHTLIGISLNTADDLKYLGAKIKDGTNDFIIRNALAWSVCNKLH